MSDALDRLRQQKRPTVPPRAADLGPAIIPNVPISGNQDIEISRSQEAEFGTGNAEPIEPVNPPLAKAQVLGLELQDSRYQDIEISGSLEPSLTVKQTTLRLEAEVAAELQAFCREAGICREVLVEAMFLYYRRNPDLMARVVETAQERNQQRILAANAKRAKSMLERFG